uniref:WD repeat-containing protein 44-like n=1 Tax=Erigeron canadensis TaxID=72917 RepID=UPI001CB8B91B|nr:WD repeat-containing protein 44-like [Erigeron canadensis]
MEGRRTMTMNWDGLGDLDDDEDLFFDAQLLSGSSSSDEEFDDSRMSFSSSADYDSFLGFQTNEYDMWMAAPESITDRRKRLLQDMGLGSNKDLLGFDSLQGASSTQILSRKTDIPPPSNVRKSEEEKQLSPVLINPNQDDQLYRQPCEPGFSGGHGLLARSRSAGGIYTSSIDTKCRKEEMIGLVSKESLTRTFSGFSTPFVGLSSSPSKGQQRRIFVAKDNTNNNGTDDDTTNAGQKESILLIKNLDNGKEFMVKECHKEGNWSKLSDVQTGKQITMEEFEKNAGHSPKVKELMRQGDDGRSGDRKLTPGNSSFKKSFKKSKKKGAALFKNIKLGSMVASKTNKEKVSTNTGSPSIDSNSSPSISEQKTSSQWVKARVNGKTFKEFTALHRHQEIQGHDGSIWAMKFTYDGHYLATAGEDKLIHIWEVQECDVMAMRSGDDPSSAGATPVHPMAMMASPDGRPPLPESTPEKKKKGKKKKGIPDYVQVPETVFGLSETPFCTLNGHSDDVLDLSWSRSRLLLSSSMDKTVRLWDIETKNCLKVFSHSDYVTCIQFNPADDDYFISGSLDSKVRIWNIPDRQVVDWIDLHEMITAVGYSNDGKVSVVGSHKGICRFYNTADCKLEFKDQVELKTKKKPQPKKITGFQFSTWNPSQVLVTSADSRVRILDGTKVVQKYKGYKNNNSQFLADFSRDEKYIISASEDSQVYIWRHEEAKGKHKHPICKTYETFPCKEVSVTAPWPGISRIAQPIVAMHSKKHSKKSTTMLPPPSPSPGFSPSPDDIGHNKPSSSPLPPMPKKGNQSTDSSDDADQHSHPDSCIGPSESFSSATGSSGRFDEMSSPLTSPSPSLKSPSWGGSHGPKTIQATAWGFVILTAGLNGEIKVFQNVGLPFKVGRL